MRALCEHQHQFDVRRLKRAGWLAGELDGESIYLTWPGGAQFVTVVYRACHFGGHRPALLCPLCGDHFYILYALDCIACRKCHRLGYAIENDSKPDRHIRAAVRIRERLGQPPGRGFLDPFPPKPKWLRWDTYMRRRDRALYHEDMNMLHLMRRFGIWR